MEKQNRDEELLRSVALQNANSILRARQRAEQDLIEAKEELRQSNERTNRILASITDGFITLDGRWNFTYLNDKAEEILGPLGKKRDQLLGRNLWEEFPGLVGTEFESAYRRAMEQKVTLEVEAFFAPLSSWFIVRAFPSSDAIALYFQDVTRRKEAEAALASEKKVLELIVSGAPLGSVLDHLAREAESQSSDGMLCSLLLLDEAGEHLVYGAAPNLRASCSTPIFSSQGELLGTIAMYYREAREPSAHDVQIIDLTAHLASIVIERKRSEDALRVTADQLRATFDQAAVGIVMAELGGRFLNMNRKFCEILGYSDVELKERTFRDITYPDDLPLTNDAMRQLAAGEIGDFAIEKRYVRRDGAVVWSLTTVGMLRNAGGEAIRFIGVIEDISKRKIAEEALRESEEQMRHLADSIPQLAFMAGPDGRVFWYNRRWYEYTGTTLPQMLDRDWHAVHDPEMLPAVMERWRHSIETGEPFEMEFPLRGADGVFRWFLTRVNPLHDRFGHVVRWFGTNTDVDQAQKAAEERKLLLESERHARGAAERASRMKDEFLATLSHELRTPLSSILGWSQILRSKTPGPEDLRKGLEIIERNTRMQTQLIEDLLDMSRITSGKVRLDVQPVMPASFMEAALETVRPAAEAKGIRLEKMIDPEAGPVSGDPSRLQQVVWNLLNNAIKFTPKDGRVQLVLERVNSHIEISVADTGQGIEPEFLDHVFERFRQADSSSTRQFGGLGLGLAIVKHLTELHGGTVRAQSAGKDQGSTFSVHLPLAVVQRGPEAQTREHPRMPPAVALDFKAVDLSGIKVLVVDDQPDARELVARVLSECKAEVLTAGTADEAVMLVERERPDVLVSDIGMPDVDGFELLKRIRALGGNRGGRVPAIALTAFARSEDRTRALHRGFQVHVSKPVEPAELIATVASVAGRTGS